MLEGRASLVSSLRFFAMGGAVNGASSSDESEYSTSAIEVADGRWCRSLTWSEKLGTCSSFGGGGTWDRVPLSIAVRAEVNSVCSATRMAVSKGRHDVAVERCESKTEACLHFA